MERMVEIEQANSFAERFSSYGSNDVTIHSEISVSFQINVTQYGGLFHK